MADYQSVLTRAIAKLPGASSAATRRAIYDRAREAMVTHLRALHPESDITREENALNQAIALVEAKFDGTEADPAELTAAKPAPSVAGHPDRVEEGACPRPAQLGQPTNSASVPSSFAQSAPAARLLRGPPTAPPSSVLQHLPAARPPSASSNLAKVVPPAYAHASRSLAVAVSIVLSLAGAAVVMRQNAQGLVIAPLEHGREMSPQAPAKITQRAQPAAEVDGSAAPPVNEAQESQSAAQSGQETSQPAPKADGSTAPVVAQSGQETSRPAPKADNGTLADAARAAMVIASQDDPQNQVVILGSTVWSIIPPSPGQPSTVAVKADADIPDLKMHASMTLRKNTDPTVQATHTIDLNFALADGTPITGFKDVAPPQMHEPDTPTSEPLTSDKVKVSDVHFLIALANGDQDAPRNLELMQTRSWFEFPLLLNDDRIAKLAFQKSSEGIAMLAKAFDAWK
jgi:hypothetical protein